jgi:hypothetical protein
MDDDVRISFDAHVEERDTPLAYCVRIDNKLEFFPKTVCRIYDKSCTIFAPEWLALKKGLI